MRRDSRSERLRIAFVVHDYNRVLGHSRYVAELAERFVREHEVHVFANRFEGVPENIVTHRVPACRFSALATIFSFVVPASMMVGRTFDVVHAQGLTVFSPDVVTAHISNARWLEGRRLLEGKNLSWRERVFAALVVPAERLSLRDDRATAIAISTALKHDLAATYGRSARTVVIPHGVDQRQFHPGVRAQFRTAVRRELGIGDDDPLFLFVGDLRKGMEPAIRALARLPWGRLVAVSRTPPDAYHAIAATCGIEDRVTFLPATDQIERYYGAADVLALPTPYDAFGMVITEAMACALPVITTPFAGAAELLADGVHGRLVSSPNDIQALADAMRALASDGEARTRMGSAASLLMQNYTWDRVADRTLAVYYEHLAARRARPEARGALLRDADPKRGAPGPRTAPPVLGAKGTCHERGACAAGGAAPFAAPPRSASHLADAVHQIRPRVLFVVDSGTDVRLVDALAERTKLRILSRRLPAGREISQATRHRVEMEVGPAGHAAFAWFAVKRLIALRREVDVVVVQGYGPTAACVNVAGRSLGRTVLMLVCSPVEAYYRCRRVASSGRPFRHLEYFAIRLFSTFNAWFGQGYVVLSPYLASVVRGHGAMKPIDVIPVYGVDRSIFHPSSEPKAQVRRRLDLPEEGHIVFFSSRVAPEKDAETVLRALKILVDRRQPVRLLHLSGGYREFAALAASAGLADHVIARDAVPPFTELADCYRASDICVQASREEGLGFSPLEALACGVPVVASAVGGLNDTIREGETGWQVPVGDENALARAISQVLGDPLEAERRTRAGAQRVDCAYERRLVFDAFVERLSRAADPRQAVQC